MVTINIIAFILVLIGCLNWGLIGIFNWNLVSAIFGVGYNAGNATIYIIVFIASLWLIFSAIYSNGRIDMRLAKSNRQKETQTEQKQ